MLTINYRIVLAFLTVTQIVFIIIVWTKLNTISGKLNGTDIDSLAVRISDELKQLKQTNKVLDVAAGDTHTALPDTASIQTMVRQVLEEELSEFVAKQDASALTMTAQNDRSRSSNSSLNNITDNNHTGAPNNEYTQQQSEAMDYSQSVINEAIASGEWTEEDNQQIIPYLDKLSNAQRIELLEQYHDAINQEKISLGAVPPPL